MHWSARCLSSGGSCYYTKLCLSQRSQWQANLPYATEHGTLSVPAWTYYRYISFLSQTYTLYGQTPLPKLDAHQLSINWWTLESRWLQSTSFPGQVWRHQPLWVFKCCMCMVCVNSILLLIAINLSCNYSPSLFSQSHYSRFVCQPCFVLDDYPSIPPDICPILWMDCLSILLRRRLLFSTFCINSSIRWVTECRMIYKPSKYFLNSFRNFSEL